MKLVDFLNPWKGKLLTGKRRKEREATLEEQAAADAQRRLRAARTPRYDPYNDVFARHFRNYMR